MIHHLTKILYCQFISFGDILVSASILKKLKDKHTNSKIDYYTMSICSPLLVGNPDINQIFTERNPPMNLETYDIILRPYRCLQASGGWHLSGKHSTDLLAEICGVDLEGDYRLYFYNVEERELPSPKYILIQCKTNDPAKDYDRFPELVSLINKTIKIPIYQIGGSKDPIIPGTAGFIKGETWPKVAYLISKAITTVCLDSVVQHLAGALNVPYMALYGPKMASMVRSGVGVLNNPAIAPILNHQYILEPPDRGGCPKWCNLAICTNSKGKCINLITPELIVSCIDKTIQREEII